jgi:hypothetical protein
MTRRRKKITDTALAMGFTKVVIYNREKNGRRFFNDLDFLHMKNRYKPRRVVFGPIITDTLYGDVSRVFYFEDPEEAMLFKLSWD